MSVIDIPAKLAVLAMPYRMHGEALRAQIETECDRVVFYDNGVAERRSGAWVVMATGAMGEAEAFARER